MNESVSWDPSLIKKFSSSNHYKLLNQLRNEVKKYPLNNKKNTSSIPTKETIRKKNKPNMPAIQNSSFTNSSNQTTKVNSNKSTVSFNNAKNFSIYNQTTNNNIVGQNESILSDSSKSNEDSSFKSFKERLDDIDMK
jgi:uncharacterized Zn finger protein